MCLSREGNKTLRVVSEDLIVVAFVLRISIFFYSYSRTVQNVVLLSDSQLHLFLQSQLSVPEIEAYVQGRGPMSVTDAILHYARSNFGWIQEDSHSALLAVHDFGNR